MFGVGFSEMMVIAVVALVVVGPERLPAVARTAGALFGRAKRYANALKADIQNEVDLEEFKSIKATFYDAAKSVENSISQVREEFDASAKSLQASIAAQSATPAAAAVDTQSVPAQMEFWQNATPVAGPTAAPEA